MDLQDAPPSFTDPEYDPTPLLDGNDAGVSTSARLDTSVLGDVHIDPLYETARGSEVPRRDVEENFKWEVNHLHDFFQRLYADEYHQLSYLKQAVSQKDAQISSLERSLMVVSRGNNVPKDDVIPVPDSPKKESIVQTDGHVPSQRPRRVFYAYPSDHDLPYWWSIAGLLCTIMTVWLILSLVLGLKAATPHIIHGPQVTNVHGGGFDLIVAMNTQGWADYLILETSNLKGKNPSNINRKEFQWNNIIWGESKLQAMAVACGTAQLNVQGQNYSISVSSVGHLPRSECQGLEGFNGFHGHEGLLSCHRCPKIVGGTNYTAVVIGRSENKRFSGIKYVKFTVPRSEAPSFVTTPSLSGITQDSVDMSVELNTGGIVNYWIQYAAMVYVSQTGMGLTHSMVAPNTLEMNGIAGGSFQGGIVANGSFNVGVGHEEVTHTIKPPCIGDLCGSFGFALFPLTSYQIYVLAEDFVGNQQDTPMQLAFTTLPDTRPPHLMPNSGPQAVTPASFEMVLEQDEQGSLYYVVLKNPDQQMAESSVGKPVMRRTSGSSEVASLAGRNLLQQLTGKGGEVLNICHTDMACIMPFTQVWSGLNITAGEEVASGCIEVKSMGKAEVIPVTEAMSNDTLYRVLVVTEDTWRPAPNRSPPIEYLVRTTDRRSPSFLGASPLVSSVGYTTFDLLLQMNEPGTVYYAITGARDEPPAVSELVNGQRELTPGRKLTSKEDFVRSGSVKITVANEKIFVRIEELEPATTYHVFAIGEDNADPPNLMKESRNVTARTLDNVPPEFLEIDVVDIQGDSMTIIVQMDEPSNVSYAIFEGKAQKCPSAEEMFDISSSTQWDPESTGIFSVRSSFQNTSHSVVGLASETAYHLCLAARDVQEFSNLQPVTNSTHFSTLDVTPPDLQAQILEGSITADGFNFQVLLNETGVFQYLLGLHETINVSQLQPPESMFDAQKESEYIRNGSLTAEANLAQLVSLSDLPSETDYILLIAARDIADKPNFFPSVVALNVSTPDVTPPVFTGGSPIVVETNETHVSFVVQMNELGVTHFIIQKHGSGIPSILEMRDYASESTAIIARGNISVGTVESNISTSVEGLEPLTSYKLFLLAEDDEIPKSNVQTKVTTLSFSTPDHSPPEFLLLDVAFMLPSVYRIDMMLNEAGHVSIIGGKTNSSPPDVINVLGMEWGDASVPEIQQTLHITSPNLRFSVGGCGIDENELYHLYFAAEDDETPPNTNPEPLYRILDTSGPTPHPPLNCTLSEDLVGISRPVFAITDGGPGLWVGAAFDQQGANFSHSFTALNNMAPGSSGIISVSMGGTILPKPMESMERAEMKYTVQRQPAAKAETILRTPELYDENNSDEGRILSIRYQLWDEEGHSQVDTESLQIHVVFKPLVGGDGRDIGTCGLDETALKDTGVGDCELVMTSSLFPMAVGPEEADITIEARWSGVTVASSRPSRVHLFGKPSCPQMSAIGIKAILPYRPLVSREELTVSISASSGSTSLDQFFVPVYYDTVILEFLQFTWDGIWKEPIVTSVPNQGFLGLNNEGQVGGREASAYKGAAVPLVSVMFKVKDAVSPGVYSDAMHFGSSDNPVVLTSVSSGGASINIDNKIADVCDHRGGPHSAGQIVVVEIQPRGIYSYADQSEAFNTAVLSGRALTIPIHSYLVSSWRKSLDENIRGLATCSPSSPGADAFTVTTEGGGCVVKIEDTHTEGIAREDVLVEYLGLQAVVPFRVWFPLEVRVVPKDDVLNKLEVPASIDPLCSRPLYQSTPVYVFADFGGEGLEQIRNVDVSGLVSLLSSDTSVIQISDGVAQGVSVGTDVLIEMDTATVGNSTTVSVSDDTVCVIGLDVVVATGLDFFEDSIQVYPYQDMVIGAQVVQDFGEEGAVGYFGAYATFSDGLVLDVVDEISFSSLEPDYITIQNSADPSIPSTATVTAQMGDPELCSRAIEANWDICSATIAVGTAPVRVVLPMALNISTFSASSLQITTRDPVDAAFFEPIKIPLESTLSVVVLFSDGLERDMSRDDRLVFNVISGSSRCEAFISGPGMNTVARTPAASSESGTCTIEVTIPDFGNPDLVSEIQLEVVVVDAVHLHLQHYDTRSLQGDLSVISPPVYGPDTLHKIGCGMANYQQVTAWLVAELSDTTYESVTKDATFESSDPGTVIVIQNVHESSLMNRLRPLQAGSVTVSGRYEGLSTSTVINVDDSAPVFVTKMTLSSIWCGSSSNLQCYRTFSGTKMTETTLQAQIELDDGFVFNEPLLGSSNSVLDILDVEDILSFSSSMPTAIETQSLGDVVLLDNHNDIITMTAETVAGCTGGSPPLTSDVQVYSNLEPGPLDVDLGEQYGIQFQKQLNPLSSETSYLEVGNIFTMEVVLNSEDNILQAFHIEISFDDSIMVLEGEDSCLVGSDWPDPSTFVCAVNLPGLTDQAVINGRDMSSTASSLQSARVEVARLNFKMVAPGTGRVEARVLGTKQSDGTLKTNYVGVASQGQITVNAASPGRRKYLWSRQPASLTENVNASRVHRQHFSRRMHQVCTLDDHEEFYGDVNFDCKFEFITDAIAMAEIFGEWNPDLANFPQRYYDALVSKSGQSVAGQPSDWQRSQLDVLHRFYPRLDPSDPYYLPRSDGTTVPDLYTLSGNQMPNRPGFKDDSRLLQLISAGLNFFVEGMDITEPDEGNQYLNITLIIRDANSLRLTSGALANVQFEFLATQSFIFVNPSANPEVKATGTVLATADFLGDGGFGVSLQGSASCNMFMDEEIEVAFVVLAKDNEGASIKSSFFPFYGSSEKQKYDPEPDENVRTYKDTFVPYTTINLVDSSSPAFLPGYPSIEGIHSGGFLIAAHMTKAATVRFLITFSDSFFLPNGSWAVALSPSVISPGQVPPEVGIHWTGTLDQVGQLPFDPVGLERSNTSMWHNVTGLNGGGNYTLVVAAEGADGRTSPKLVAISGIITPDVTPPTFENITLLDSSTDETSGTFNLKLGMRLDEDSLIHFGAYIDHACITGNPSEIEVSQAEPLNSNICACLQQAECLPVGTGTISADRDNTEVTVSGNLSPLPFESLRGAGDDELFCFQGGIGQVSDALRIYFAAKDVVPNYHHLDNKCQNQSASTTTIEPNSCTIQGSFTCDQEDTLVTDDSNQQTGGFVLWSHLEGHSSGQDTAGRGGLITLSLQSPSPPQFQLLEFPEDERGPSYFIMRFQLDIQGLVVFSIASMATDIDAILQGGEGVSVAEIGNGRVPVFNSSQIHTVNVTACEPNQLVGGEKYILVVVARDKYGRVQGKAMKELIETPVL